MSPTHALTLVTLLVSAGGAYAQEPFDQTFRPDVQAPDGFRTNRTSYSAIMDVLAPSRPVLPRNVNVFRSLILSKACRRACCRQFSTA